MPGHTHDDIDWADRLAQLRMADALDAEALAPVARRLLSGAAGRPTVVDVGCGAGGMSVHFARELALGDGGTVVLLDATPALLAEAQRAVAAVAGESVEVVGVHGDLADPQLADRVPAADLVWASGVVHHVGDQQAALRTLAGLLRPGAVLAISEGGLEMRCLPWDLGIGRPGLEHRLLAARAEWFAGMRAGIAGSVAMPYGWPRALREAGLEDVESFGALIDHPMPGSDLLREYVVHRVGWLAGSAGDRLDADDRATIAALTDPAGPDFLGHRADLYLLGAKAIHSGRSR
ncbi:bifunctional 2-polyprenyl-6-hydroxyphenol methylase/3-demethylubiquinol 3-O-methyltransferase UbiG [Amycolatopsis sp. WQ 127309]|uniref:class I SAM-dependent methyltransferase n=1 Tax=Amycolatopsis sp. WQ 127309 TaxID=2932773 RepID=UPI001FF2CD7F|nr:class I SAM-dependent methyltransferase [Amycolatopsis sp. WQ 127309]UOZ10166.1 methyltransferase [Amycolatopsis sp. WQ 127309]